MGSILHQKVKAHNGVKKLTNKEIIKAVRGWQDLEIVHPLTCGNNSNHQNLVPLEVKSKVILICPDCEYKQNWVPDYVMNADVVSMRPEFAKMIKR